MEQYSACIIIWSHDHALHQEHGQHIIKGHVIIMQVEDKEGETPLSMAAKHGKLRDLMVQVATGKMDVDELL